MYTYTCTCMYTSHNLFTNGLIIYFVITFPWPRLLLVNWEAMPPLLLHFCAHSLYFHVPSYTLFCVPPFPFQYYMHFIARSRTFCRRRFVAVVSSPPFRRWCTSPPAISSQVHFISSHFIVGTLRRLPFHHWDNSSPAVLSWGHFVAGARRRLYVRGIRLSSKTTSWKVCKPYLYIVYGWLVNIIHLWSLVLVFIFTIFKHMYLIVIRFNIAYALLVNILHLWLLVFIFTIFMRLDLDLRSYALVFIYMHIYIH